MYRLTEARAVVNAAVEAEREVALALHDEGFSWAEIGAAVGLSAEGARSRYATIVVDGVRQRIPLEVPLPGISPRDLADVRCIPRSRVQAMIEGGEVEVVRVPYRGRTVTRIVGLPGR